MSIHWRMVIPFFAASGCFQLATSVVTILILHSYLGQTNRFRWLRVISIMLILNFAFNLAFGVTAAMYHSECQDFIKHIVYWYWHWYWFFRWFNLVIKFINFTFVEVLLSFVITLPLTGLTLHAFLEKLWENIKR